MVPGRHHHNKKCPKYQMKGNNSGSSGNSSLREDGSGSADATTTDEDDEDECDSEEDNCHRNSTKPVLRKHGKLISFFRSFILSRPTRGKLKKSGILKERVFGCDLSEHLVTTGEEVSICAVI